MVVNTERLVIELKTRGTARMKDVAGTRIDCLRGRIWITEQGVKDDQVLDAGESYIISKGCCRGTGLARGANRNRVACRASSWGYGLDRKIVLAAAACARSIWPLHGRGSDCRNHPSC
jgi:hypothetical protein